MLKFNFGPLKGQLYNAPVSHVKAGSKFCHFTKCLIITHVSKAEFAFWCRLVHYVCLDQAGGKAKGAFARHYCRFMSLRCETGMQTSQIQVCIEDL